jgi:hypothetical protein
MSSKNKTAYQSRAGKRLKTEEPGKGSTTMCVNLPCNSAICQLHTKGRPTMGKQRDRRHIPAEFYDYLIENFKIIIITKPGKQNYMKIRLEPRKKRSGK